MLLAIDFGTSRTRAAVRISGPPQPVILSESEESPDMPSAVFVAGEGKIFVGERARRERLVGGEDVATRYFARREFKLDIGNPIQPLIGKGEAAFSLPRRELVAAILRYCKQKAESQFPEAGSFSTLVLTVPAMYTPGGPAWRVMEEAGRSLEIPDVQIISEPHAAALYYGDLLRRASIPSSPGELTLIYDLGGGTFDPAIVASAEEGYRVLHLGGESEELKLGGTMIDDFLDEDFAARFPEAHQLVQFRNKKEGPEDETKEARKLRLQREIDYERFLFQTVKHGMASNKDFEECEPLLDESYVLTTKQFSELIDERLIEQTARCCEALLQRTGTDWAQIRRIVMVGGTCRLPAVRQKLQQLVERNGVPTVEVLWRTVGTLEAKPELAVVLGAAAAKGVKSSWNAGLPTAQSPRLVPQFTKLTHQSLGGSKFLAERLAAVEIDGVTHIIEWTGNPDAPARVLWRIPDAPAQEMEFEVSSNRIRWRRNWLDLVSGAIWFGSKDLDSDLDKREQLWQQLTAEFPAGWDLLDTAELGSLRLVRKADLVFQLYTYDQVWQSRDLPNLKLLEKSTIAAFRDPSEIVFFTLSRERWTVFTLEQWCFIDQGTISIKTATPPKPATAAGAVLSQKLFGPLGKPYADLYGALFATTFGLPSVTTASPNLGSNAEVRCCALGEVVLFCGAEGWLALWSVVADQFQPSAAIARKFSAALEVVWFGLETFVVRQRGGKGEMCLEVRQASTKQMNTSVVKREHCRLENGMSSNIFSPYELNRKFWEGSGRSNLPLGAVAIWMNNDPNDAWFIVDPSSPFRRFLLFRGPVNVAQQPGYSHGQSDKSDLPFNGFSSGDLTVSRNREFALATRVGESKLIRVQPVEELAKIPLGGQATWSPDSCRFAIHHGSILTVYLTGSEQPVWSCDFGEDIIELIAFSRTNDRLAVLTRSPGGLRNLTTLNSKSGKHLFLLPTVLDSVDQICFAKSGDYLILVMRDGRLRAQHLFEPKALNILHVDNFDIEYTDEGIFRADPKLWPLIGINTEEGFAQGAEALTPFHQPDQITALLEEIF